MESHTKHPILPHFRPSCSPKNDRYGHLESNALIGIEFGEFRKKIRRQHTCMQFLKVPRCNMQVCWNPARSRKNDRYGHSESNGLIGIEFYEFRQKLKNLEFRQNSIFWESLGAIWIDSVSFEVVPPLSIFSFLFQFLSSGLEGPRGVVSGLRRMHRYGFLAWKR